MRKRNSAFGREGSLETKKRIPFSSNTTGQVFPRRRDEGVPPLGEQELSARGTGPRGVTQPLCDICGHPLAQRNCKLICTNCGFRRDCSDP